MKNVDTSLFGYVDWGRYFGYPECCVVWFVENRINRPVLLPWPGDLTASQIKLAGYSGFIPYPSCAAGTKDAASLIVNRQCSTPFPDDSDV